VLYNLQIAKTTSTDVKAEVQPSGQKLS
jgi:hypothetical protein